MPRHPKQLGSMVLELILRVYYAVDNIGERRAPRIGTVPGAHTYVQAENDRWRHG
jgi:hypothetical protein